MMQLCQLPMLLSVVGWTTLTHFPGVSPSSVFTDYSLSKIVQLELLQIRVNIYSDNSGTQETPLAACSVLLRVQTSYPVVQVYSNWLP